MSNDDVGHPEDPSADRWSRGASIRPPITGSAPLQLTEEEAARLASRAERAARLTPTQRISVRRPDEVEFSENGPEEAVVVEEVIDLTETTSPIELDETVDLRASAEPEPVTAEVVSEPAGDDVATGVTRPVDTGSTRSPRAPGAPTTSTSTSPSSSGSDSGGTRAPRPPMPESAAPETVSLPVPAPSTELAPLQHAVLPALIEQETTANRTAFSLLVIAGGLAVLSGVLGLMWILERSNTADLRAEAAELQARVDASEEVAGQGLEELNDEIRTLTLQNEQLEQQRNELSALVLELPEGRIRNIAVPFTPLFADEAENGRLIAVSDAGEYIIWGEGVDGGITDSGSLAGSPTGLFAATGKAWVSTDAGTIEAVSLVAGVPGLPSADVGPTTFLAPEERGYWSFNAATGEVVRRKKSDGAVTAAVAVPVDVVDLTIGAGSVWALGADGRVYRINTADLTVTPLDAGTDLISVTAGPDALWTLSAADGSLRRVDPVTGEVLVTVPVGRDPIDAQFAGRSVWVALRSGSSLIEVDTRTAAVVSRTPLSGEPTALHQGESGVFVTTNGEVPLLRVSSLQTDSGDENAAAEGDADSDDS